VSEQKRESISIIPYVRLRGKKQCPEGNKHQTLGGKKKRHSCDEGAGGGVKRRPEGGKGGLVKEGGLSKNSGRV